MCCQKWLLPHLNLFKVSKKGNNPIVLASSEEWFPLSKTHFESFSKKQIVSYKESEKVTINHVNAIYHIVDRLTSRLLLVRSGYYLINVNKNCIWDRKWGKRASGYGTKRTKRLVARCRSQMSRSKIHSLTL